MAVVASRGVLYAVADYSRGVEQLGAPQVEARVGGIDSRGGVAIIARPEPGARRLRYRRRNAAHGQAGQLRASSCAGRTPT